VSRELKREEDVHLKTIIKSVNVKSCCVHTHFDHLAHLFYCCGIYKISSRGFNPPIGQLLFSINTYLKCKIKYGFILGLLTFFSFFLNDNLSGKLSLRSWKADAGSVAPVVPLLSHGFISRGVFMRLE